MKGLNESTTDTMQLNTTAKWEKANWRVDHREQWRRHTARRMDAEWLTVSSGAVPLAPFASRRPSPASNWNVTQTSTSEAIFTMSTFDASHMIHTCRALID